MKSYTNITFSHFMIISDKKWEMELINFGIEFFNIPKVIYEVHYTEKYSVVAVD